MNRISAVLALTLAGAALGAPGTAMAAPATSADVVKMISKVKVDPHDPLTATVKAQYRCTGGEGVMWASVKQSFAGDDLTGEGSSVTADAWYDVHAPVVCDGKLRTQTFTMTGYEDHPWVPGKTFDPIVHGTGYVQLCLTVGGTEEGFDSVMEYASVHAR